MATNDGQTSAGSAGYEFTGTQNTVLRATASRVWIWGAFTFAAGCMAALVGVTAIIEGTPAGYLGAVIYGLLCLIPVYIGLVFLQCGKELKAVVTTRGSDIDHLMRAIGNLGAAFIVQIVATALWIGVLVSAVLAALIVPRFGG